MKLDGDPQHAGFQFRASQDVADKTAKQTYYLRPDGKDEPGKFRNWPGDKEHVDLPWYALSFVLDDQRYTAAISNHPEQPDADAVQRARLRSLRRLLRSGGDEGDNRSSSTIASGCNPAR